MENARRKSELIEYKKVTINSILSESFLESGEKIEKRIKLLVE
jgi:hypothetical protein